MITATLIIVGVVLYVAGAVYPDPHAGFWMANAGGLLVAVGFISIRKRFHRR